MHSILTAYTVYYNLRHKRHGHLLDGRFGAKVVSGDDYLLRLSRYLHLNPVYVSRMKKKPIKERIEYLRAYKWSSYPGYIDKRKKEGFVDYGPMLAGMCARKSVERREYRKFVETGLAETDDDLERALKASPLSIGNEEFRAWAEDLYDELAGGRNCPEDVSFRHMLRPLEVDVVLEVLSDVLKVGKEDFCKRSRNSPLRVIAAKCLMKYAGRTERQAAEILCVGTGSAISKQITRYSEILSSDRKWSKLTAKLEKRLNAKRKETRKHG